jgi:hypothetical protein
LGILTDPRIADYSSPFRKFETSSSDADEDKDKEEDPKESEDAKDDREDEPEPDNDPECSNNTNPVDSPEGDIMTQRVSIKPK